jgi:hypothetical protein
MTLGKNLSIGQMKAPKRRDAVNLQNQYSLVLYQQIKLLGQFARFPMDSSAGRQLEHAKPLQPCVMEVNNDEQQKPWWWGMPLTLPNVCCSHAEKIARTAQTEALVWTQACPADDGPWCGSPCSPILVNPTHPRPGRSAPGSGLVLLPGRSCTFPGHNTPSIQAGSLSVGNKKIRNNLTA